MNERVKFIFPLVPIQSNHSNQINNQSIRPSITVLRPSSSSVSLIHFNPVPALLFRKDAARDYQEDIQNFGLSGVRGEELLPAWFRRYSGVGKCSQPGSPRREVCRKS